MRPDAAGLPGLPGTALIPEAAELARQVTAGMARRGAARASAGARGSERSGAPEQSETRPETAAGGSLRRSSSLNGLNKMAGALQGDQ